MTTNDTQVMEPVTDCVAIQKWQPRIAHKTVLVLLAVGVFAVVAFLLWWPKATADTTPTAPSATTTSTVAAVPSAATMAKVIALLTSAGWDSSQYTFAVDESKDPTTGGQEGDFSSAPIRSAAAMVTFLQSSSAGADGIKSSVESSTGATEADLYNPANWVAVQSTVPFNYPGNTGLKDGAIFGSGTLSGYAGEIFLVFVAPETVADVTSNSGTTTVRTACANPQTVCPTPSTTTSTTSTSTPTPTPGLEVKDARQGVEENPAVADWKKDDGATHSVNNNDGATDPAGYQSNPAADAANAASNAAAASTDNTVAHSVAVVGTVVNGGGTVDSNQSHTTTTNPDW